MTERHLLTGLLARAGRLLLEYNESTGAIHRRLCSTARALTGITCQVAVSYGGVAVSFEGEPPILESVNELRYNTALHARVCAILDQVRHRTLEPAEAIAALARVEAETRRHPQWLAVIVLGLAAVALARILGADGVAAGVAGVATGLGLIVRRELGRRHASLLILPLAAALIGGLFGSFAIQQGWTLTPELVLVVPSLMLVPGPHLINGLLDLLDNEVPMGLARLGLATGILLASALGIVIAIEITSLEPLADCKGGNSDHLNIVSDMLLAGIATCGFAVFYNTRWRHIGLAVLGGMAGHGVRFLALEAGCRLVVATFLGAAAIGLISACLARFGRIPVAIAAFAGAVTMMPGLLMYRSLGGAVLVAHLHEQAGAAAVAAMLGNVLEASLIVGALAIGLLAGVRLVVACTGEPQ